MPRNTFFLKKRNDTFQLPPEERAESIMREAFLWGQVAGPILGGCLVWGRSGPSMVFSRAVLSACLASLLVPAAWRGPSHVALRLFQGLCTVRIKWSEYHEDSNVHNIILQEKIKIKSYG